MNIVNVTSLTHMQRMLAELRLCNIQVKFLTTHREKGVVWELTEMSFMETCVQHQYHAGFFENITYSEYTNSFIYRG